MKSTDNTTIFARSFRDRYYYAPWEIVIQGWTSGCPCEGRAEVYYTLYRKGRRQGNGYHFRVVFCNRSKTRLPAASSLAVFWCLGADAWLNIHFHISRYVSNVKRRPHTPERWRKKGRGGWTRDGGRVGEGEEERGGRPRGSGELVRAETSLSPRVVSQPSVEPSTMPSMGSTVLPIPSTLTAFAPPSILSFSFPPSLFPPLSFSLFYARK